LIAKANRLVRLRRDGLPWEEILLSEERPLMSVLFAETAEAMMRANSRVRRTQAQALRRAGVTLTRIGELLGVTRQRVSALLRGRR
jgi:predicted XRE-type DNA-binding protein